MTILPHSIFNVDGNNNEQLRMNKIGPKLCNSLYRQYCTLNLHKELQSKTLNTKVQNINSIKLGSLILT